MAEPKKKNIMESFRGRRTETTHPSDQQGKEMYTTSRAEAEPGEKTNRLSVRAFFHRPSSSRRRHSSNRRSEDVLAQERRSPVDTQRPIVVETSSAAESCVQQTLSLGNVSDEKPSPNSPLAVQHHSMQESQIELEISGTDIWNVAFREACKGYDSSELTVLAQTSGVCELFKDLERQNSEHDKASFFQRGVRVMSPYLKGLNFFLNISDPISNFEPSTSSALALVKMVTTIGLTICGASESMRVNIETLLKQLPRIDLCDTIHTGRPVPEVQGALTLVYKDLLEFFFETRTILESEHFVICLLKSNVKGKVADILSSFLQNVENLDKLIILETNVIARQLLEERINDEVQNRLDTNREKEVEYHNTLKIRANDACDWITANPSFRDWVSISPGPEFIAMFGDMGCGKTVTMAYVVDFLRSNPDAIGMTCPLVCSYYCKDDGETSNVRNVYRSILSQLLAAKEPLIWLFHTWYKKKRGTLQVDPTQSIDDLREVLMEIMTSLRQWLFIIIDGLDECDNVSKKHILGFLNQLEAQPVRVRVFVSSRHDDDIQRRMPKKTKVVHLQSSMERDHRIVSHLVKQYMDSTTEQLQSFLVSDLTEKAQGCAIWSRMVLEYLQSTRMTKEGPVKKALEGMPSPRQLSELYMRLFERIVNDIPENRWILTRSLEILAATLRPLTLQELSYAVSIEKYEGAKVNELSELVEFEDSERILQLTKPFVSIVNSEDTRNAHLRLVHQSLKEVIVNVSPMDWESTSVMKSKKSTASRQDELNGLILKLCVNYLLFKEFGELQLLPETQREKEWALANLNEDPEPEVYADMVSFDLFDRGFGAFYSYAACYWIHHFRHSSQTYMPRLEDLITLSHPGSLRLKNWLDCMRRPNWGDDLECDLVLHGYNPLALIVWFGPEAELIKLLDLGLETAGMTDAEAKNQSIWTAVQHAISKEKFSIVRVFLNHPATSSILRDVSLFFKMSRKWNDFGPAKDQEWRDLLHEMSLQLEDVLVEYANAVLLVAAKAGCLPMVKLLFHSAATNPSLKESLFKRTEDEYGPVGEAAFWRHIEVLDYLCQQEGIEVHLHHRDSSGDNIMHNVARHGDPEVFRILIKHFPEGVNESNGSTTPLQTLVNHQSGIKAVKVLLEEGKADVNLGDPYFMPLRSAVRWGLRDVSRLLVVLGSADPWIVVQVSDVGQPFLTEHIQIPDPSILIPLEREILRDLCSLMPLAVSMDYLSPTMDLNQVLGS